MSVQFNVAIQAAAPGVTADIIASAPFDISRDRLPPRTRTPKYSDKYFIWGWGCVWKGVLTQTRLSH